MKISGFAHPESGSTQVFHGEEGLMKRIPSQKVAAFDFKLFGRRGIELSERSER